MDGKCSMNYEAECQALHREMARLVDERDKVCIQYEQSLKHNADLEKEISYLKGQVAAYEYCISGGNK